MHEYSKGCDCAECASYDGDRLIAGVLAAIAIELVVAIVVVLVCMAVGWL